MYDVQVNVLKFNNQKTFTFHFHAFEKEMATHSSVLAWRIPGTAEPGGLPSLGVAQSRTRLKRLSSSSHPFTRVSLSLPSGLSVLKSGKTARPVEKRGRRARERPRKGATEREKAKQASRGFRCGKWGVGSGPLGGRQRTHVTHISALV